MKQSNEDYLLVKFSKTILALLLYVVQNCIFWDNPCNTHKKGKNTEEYMYSTVLHCFDILIAISTISYFLSQRMKEYQHFQLSWQTANPTKILCNPDTNILSRFCLASFFFLDASVRGQVWLTWVHFLPRSLGKHLILIQRNSLPHFLETCT
jgi:hypothetical protein